MISDREKLNRLRALYSQLPVLESDEFTPWERALRSLLRYQIIERGLLLNDEHAIYDVEATGEPMIDPLALPVGATVNVTISAVETTTLDAAASLVVYEPTTVVEDVAVDVAATVEATDEI